ncbi:hypothetical protein PDIG_14770 [Penicillium digitatum PHI26]|uniref:Uncharacterized protein n=2 Tax=Penicillium digitatum TaxID=36651 RepID=K9G8Y2_PEND2|nr:hypothetical protein PDIP_02240 [Penicillium digitatum Pd1]EKV17462.1 hypothetical protein PDIG_14770 [Penicillium digitatum PHI26]EKV21860.1 hypothetical protein PDIP_02240 [Penicillium digitatum Pd1]
MLVIRGIVSALFKGYKRNNAQKLERCHLASRNSGHHCHHRSTHKASKTTFFLQLAR